MKQIYYSLLGLILLAGAGGMPAGTATAIVEPKTLNEIDPLRDDSADFLNEDLSATLQSGVLKFKQGRFLDAARCFLYVLRRDADNAELMFLLSQCHARLGRPKPAARFLLAAVNSGFTDMERIRGSKSFIPLMGDPGFRKNRSTVLSWGEAMGNLDFIPSRRLEPLRIHLPRKHDPQKAYTLLIGLHGNGDNAANFSRIWKDFGRNDFIFAVPQGTYEKAFSGVLPGRHFSWDMETRDKQLWAIADPLVPENILEVRNHIARRFRISDTYLLGFSQGTAYTYATAIRHPDKIRGIICFAGNLPPADKPWSLYTQAQLQAAKGLRVFIAHGRGDGAIGFSASARIHAALSGLGYASEFHPFDGGHELPPKMLQKAVDWMMKENTQSPSG